MTASHDQATAMIAALRMVPAIRPALRLRRVWLRNICSWARQSSSPTSIPATTRPIGLSLEATQDRADILLPAPGQPPPDPLHPLPLLPHPPSQLLQAAH